MSQRKDGKTDTDEIHLLMKNARGSSIPDTAISLMERAAQISIAGDYPLGAATALCAIGSKYSDMGNYAAAAAYGKQALPYALKAGSNSQIAFCHNLFGVIAFMQGNYVQATSDYLQALEAIKDTTKASTEAAITIYTNLANVSTRLGQKEKVMNYLNKAETLARDERISPGMVGPLLAGLLINKGNYFTNNDIDDSAKPYYTEVLEMAAKMENTNRRIRFQALAEVNLGHLYLKTGDYKQAAAYCRDAYSLAKNNYAYIAASAAYALGKALHELGQYREAEEVLVAALAENNAANLKDQAVMGYTTLVEVYKKTGQHKKALEAMDGLLALKDSIMSAEKAKAISQLEAKYELTEKDKKLAQKELLIAQQKNKLARKNSWIIGILAASIVFALVSGGLYFHHRQKQKSIIKSLQQDNTISILKAVVQGEENERTRLARDLHDGIGGMLSATKMRFMALRHDNEALIRSPRYLEAMGLLDIMGDEIRKTSHNLMPEALMKQDLPEALRSYCNNIQAGSMHIDFQSFGNFEAIQNDFKLNLYRIVQELLKNTLQHAKATYCVVQLMMLKDYLTINVEDNGSGFDTVETKDGIGLNNLKTRVLNYNGHYTLKSEIGKGTTVYIEFELPTNISAA